MLLFQLDSREIGAADSFAALAAKKIAQIHKIALFFPGIFKGVEPLEPCRKKVRVWESAVNRFARGANLERGAEDTADCQLAVEEAGARGIRNECGARSF